MLDLCMNIAILTKIKNLQSVTKYFRLWFSCEIAHNAKSLIAIFGDFSASINKIFTVAERMGTKLSFYEV